MSDALAQPAAQPQPATLELEGAVRITGDLSTLLDGRLQLGSTRLLAGPGAKSKVSLRPGMVATLGMARRAGGAPPPEPVAVSIGSISGDTLTLEFVDGTGAAARRCREAIAGRAPSGAQTLALGATAEYSALLGELQRHSLDQLAFLLERFLRDLASHLFALSSHSRLAEPRKNPYYEASAAISRNAPRIVEAVIGQLSGYYQDLTPGQSDDHLPQHSGEESEDLDIIDIEEFEGLLAIDRMINLGEDLHRIALEALTIRLATLIEADPLRVRLPVHVRQLCRAFQRALSAQALPAEVTTHIYDFFAQRLVRGLDAYFSGLNERLAAGGVRPELEQQIRKKGSLLKEPGLVRPARGPGSGHPGSGHPGSGHPGFDHQETGPPGEKVPESGAGNLEQYARQLTQQLVAHSFSPEKLYSSVIDALNFKREADGLASGQALASGTPLSGTWDGATVPSSELDQHRLADARAIARALSAIQHDSQVRAAVQQTASLRAYLAETRNQIGELRDTSGLTAESLNQLDLVDNLFDTIRSQLDVSAELKPALGNLQIPLARLALLDPRFFLDRTHAARNVVDKLSRLATSANFPNKALEDRINGIVDQIVAEYESDNSVFDTALDRIERLAAQQERALARNIERVVRIQEGQEKLRRARQAVDRVISTRIRPPAAPGVLLDLIDSGWRDLMVLTHVKNGAGSRAWREQVRTLDLLARWLGEQLREDVNKDLLAERTVKAETLIQTIGEQIAAALPTTVAHEPVLAQLRDTLAGNRKVVSAAVADSLAGALYDPDRQRARIEELPRLRRWVRRVEQLEKDCWLTYRGEDGRKRRMQLAWISTDRDRYIFVNERGQKIADLSAIQLARQLSRGAQPPAPTDGFSVVDRSIYQTLEHVQKTLSFARNHDSLTRLINRQTFLEQMRRALHHAQQKGSQHAVLYLNIDQFNLVNDIYDRVNGDQVLLEFAKLLAQLHGSKFSSARIEADEFAMLLLDRSMEQALQVAEKVRGDIAASSVEIEGEKVTFTVSIGVAPILEQSAGVEQLLAQARSAMHRAKDLGRDRVSRFEEEQAVGAGGFKRARSRARQDLEQALATDYFVLRAQPIVQTAVDGSTPSTRHFELLLGLVSPDGSLTSPEEFIQSAERYGFMELVDRWVVKEAFSWISRLMDAQKTVPNLAINLSGESVTDDGFMEYLLEQISEFGVGTSRICFEITETGTISNLVKAADFVRTLRNIGCKFSIDDFGTGLASHNYLRELPVDYVKIDGSFITGIHTSRNDYAMARSINDLAHFLGRETIAESVENEQIVGKLREIGVDYLQGWGVGRPRLLSEISADLSSLVT
jgi:diguanylate cyclase (GGDEF)-like protein